MEQIIFDKTNAKEFRSRTAEKKKGKLIKGNNKNYAELSFSIPSQYQRIVLKDPLLEGINPTQYEGDYAIKKLFDKLPGPGNYEPIIEKAREYSSKGYTNGFTSKLTKELPHKTNHQLGPGYYNSNPIKNERTFKAFEFEGRKTNDDSNLIKIPINDKNPLNLIKPITLNIYLRPNMPGPTDYDTYPREQENNKYNSVFNSKTKKSNNLINDSSTPGVGEYLIAGNLEFKNKFRQNKKKSEVRKLNKTGLEFLGERVELLNNRFIENPDTFPDSINYGKIPKVLDKVNAKYNIERKEKIQEIIRTSEVKKLIEIEKNYDRFGLVVNKKTPIENIPGPGSYIHDNNSIRNSNTVTAFINNIDRFADSKEKKPGPAYYKPMEMAPKLSFHLNLKQKWV